MTDTLAPPDDKREAHLHDYWRIVWRGRWAILSIFVVAVTLVAIGNFTHKPIYRATASVEITTQDRKVSPVADVDETGASHNGCVPEDRDMNTQFAVYL